jgi:hypothetical protein
MWTDQLPEPTDILIVTRAPGSKSVFVEIDRLSDGTYRATAGDLFGSKEITRDSDLETVLRKVGKTQFRS